MNTLKAGIPLALLGVAAAGLVTLYRSNAKLKQDMVGLSDQAREVDRLRSEQRDLAIAHTQDCDQLNALRTDLAALQTRAQTGDHGVAPQPTSEPADSKPGFTLATGLTPVEELKNAGKATATASLETRMWAHAGGDTSMIVSTMVLLPETRQKAEELFARLPEEARGRYHSPDELLANIFAGTTGPGAAGVQVLSEQPGARVEGMPDELRNDPRYKTLHVQTQNTKGVVRENDFVFQQTEDGWRQVIFPNTVGKAAQVFLNRATAPVPKSEPSP